MQSSMTKAPVSSWRDGGVFETSYPGSRKVAIALAVAAFALVTRPDSTVGSDTMPGLQGARAGSIPEPSKPPPSSPPLHTPEKYRLDRGDRLRIRFFDRFDREDLNGEYILGERGALRLPRIGAFEARNKSTAELEQEIREFVEKRGEKLGYFSIDIAECRPFYVAGLANRPGSYPFASGMTVLHSVLLAGGIYRSPSSSLADAMKERGRLADTLERLKELLARRARLEAERDGNADITVPDELVQLEPVRAGKMIDLERNLLQRHRDVASREKVGHENFAALTSAEADSYQVSITAITQRIAEQTRLFAELRSLHDRKIVNQQRFFEAVAALDAAQRDKHTAIAGLSHAKASLEKAKRDLSMLTLANNARIAKELAETEQEIARLKKIAGETRQLVAGLEALSGQGQTGQAVTYRIIRRNAAGELSILQAAETTPIMPGDVVQIVSRIEDDSVKLH